MRARHVGVGKNAVLGVVLVIVAGAAVFNFYNYFKQAPAHPPQKLQPTPRVEDSPSRPRGNVVWLQANQAQYVYWYNGITSRELFRQAVLIAARDELGLETRDASLREWQAQPSPEGGLEMDFESAGVTLHDVQSPAYPRWHRLYDQKNWPTDVDSIVESTEKMSRDDYVGALKKAGWSGTGNLVKSDAPAPGDADVKLMEMEELSQFGVLRETHAAIRADGESLQRLGALVRAYANLGQLTRYHWSLEYAVFTARSLLYAQRMVVNNPNSAVALWHRAYARAMAGLQGGALDDLKAAGYLQGGNPPAWVALLDPFCRYQTGTLVNLATSDPKISTLGMFLAFLTVEQSSSQAAIMGVAQAAFTINPDCLRLVDAMCNQCGPGMLNELSETGPTLFSQMLGSDLQKFPSFPKTLSDQIDGFRRPEGNPTGRETICQELIALGAPERDGTEPSWTALGRLIQETTFAHIERKANLISEQWCIDASDYAKEVQPSVAEHPFKFMIDVYGLKHSADMETLKRTLNEPTLVSMETTMREMPNYWLETQILSCGPQSARNCWGWICSNSDFNSFDIEGLENFSQGQENSSWGNSQLSHLRKVSPESPILIASDIRGHWDAAKAVKWEQDHGDYPAVAKALGQKYAALNQWADAERCIRRYLNVSPDYDGYEILAKIYKDQDLTDLWLATLKEYLAHGKDYGLQYSNAQEEIANYYMDKRDYKSALPYADTAAQTASCAGLQCAAAAHTGLEDWATAEQLIVENMNHYSTSPYDWYSWCNHTGHGDLVGATKAMSDYFTNKGDNIGDEDLIQLGCLEMSQEKNAEALATFQKRLKLFPGPISALHIAILYDELHNAASRDAALDQIQAMPEHDTSLGRFAVVLRNAGKNGPDAPPDPGALAAILKNSSDIERIEICALASQYLDDRGQVAEATRYLKLCIGAEGYCVDRLLVDSKLRQRGLNPWALEQAATLPSN